MSEQIDSMLEEMENKFEQSFSQQDLNLTENQIVSEDNPQSANKHDNQKDMPLYKENLFQDQIILQKQLLQQLNVRQEHNFNEQNLQKLRTNNADIYQDEKQLFQNKHNFQVEKDLTKAVSEQQFYSSQINLEKNSSKGQSQYKDLTLKLQRALHKISSESAIRHKNNINTIYDRFQQYQQKRNKQLQRKKKQIQYQQQKSLRDRPLINSNSRLMISQIKEQPLFMRYQKIIDKKKAKQFEYEKIRQERTQKQYQEFQKQHKKYMEKLKKKYKKEHLRSSQEYYEEMQSWLRNREKNLQNSKNQRVQRQKKEFTFKPLINSKSEKILSKKSLTGRVSIQDRQPTMRQPQPDPQCTFKPKINKNYFYKKQNFDYYQSCTKL